MSDDPRDLLYTDEGMLSQERSLEENLLRAANLLDHHIHAVKAHSDEMRDALQTAASWDKRFEDAQSSLFAPLELKPIDTDEIYAQIHKQWTAPDFPVPVAAQGSNFFWAEATLEAANVLTSIREPCVLPISARHEAFAAGWKSGTSSSGTSPRLSRPGTGGANTDDAL